MSPISVSRNYVSMLSAIADIVQLCPWIVRADASCSNSTARSWSALQASRCRWRRSMFNDGCVRPYRTSLGEVALASEHLNHTKFRVGPFYTQPLKIIPLSTSTQLSEA